MSFFSIEDLKDIKEAKLDDVPYINKPILAALHGWAMFSYFDFDYMSSIMDEDCSVKNRVLRFAMQDCLIYLFSKSLDLNKIVDYFGCTTITSDQEEAVKYLSIFQDEIDLPEEERKEFNTAFYYLANELDWSSLFRSIIEDLCCDQCTADRSV